MKSVLFLILALLLVITGLFFFFRENAKNDNISRVQEEPAAEWKDIPPSPALERSPAKVHVLFDTAKWQDYVQEGGYAFKYPPKQEEFFLEPYVREENKKGTWYGLEDALWSAIVRIPEPVRERAEGLFAISVYTKDGVFEEVLHRVRQFIVGENKNFFAERAIRGGGLEGVKLSAVDEEGRRYTFAYVLYRAAEPKQEKSETKLDSRYHGKIFIIDVAITRIEDPAETDEQFADRVAREEKYLDALVSTFTIL